MRGRILVVDDDAAMCELLASILSDEGYAVTTRSDPDAAVADVHSGDFEAVLTDLNMRGMGGLELCRRVVSTHPDLPVLVITAFGSLETAIGAIRAGAYDFITKPVETDALVVALDRAVAHHRLRIEVKQLRDAVDASRRYDELLGDSPPMRRVYEMLDRMVDSDATVLIAGESGTGKEIVARTLHARGPRRDGPFVAVNCAAVPDTLLESELFGHARGAFTDARQARIGLFQRAHGGTLFLDEIGELSLALQPKLLRVLQERTIRPLGADQEIPFDVRLVTATNRDLESAVEEQRFRQDLYFRVNVLRIHLPPLRARGGDVLLLAQEFLDRVAARTGKRVTGISPDAAERLLSYAWPGNVRELQNCIERAVALTRYTDIAVEDLPEAIRDYRPDQLLIASDNPAQLPPMEEVERRYIRRVMQAVRGNKTLAAQVLGFDRRTLYRKLERFGDAE